MNKASSRFPIQFAVASSKTRLRFIRALNWKSKLSRRLSTSRNRACLWRLSRSRLLRQASSSETSAEIRSMGAMFSAEGEYSASEKLAMAAEGIQKQPAAIQLRYLQTLVEIGTEKNTIIVFPLPLDILASFKGVLDQFGGANGPGAPRS